MIVVQNPLAEPMIHCDFPGGLIDLQEYVLEVLEGIKTIASGRLRIPPMPAGNIPITSVCSIIRYLVSQKFTTRLRLWSKN